MGVALALTILLINALLMLYARAVIQHAADAGAAAHTAPASALRQCALLARLLEVRATDGRDAGRSAFEMLLLGHAARFEESFRRRSGDAC